MMPKPYTGKEFMMKRRKLLKWLGLAPVVASVAPAVARGVASETLPAKQTHLQKPFFFVWRPGPLQHWNCRCQIMPTVAKVKGDNGKIIQVRLTGEQGQFNERGEFIVGRVV